uniref:calcium and integrin-binding protein 1 isoform X1 n=1 Tax=Agelaius phoeniceus TaxID=39638 RepID=UPI0023EBE3BA|nr:calcium and integrin-binding protein 1 isoform X1 [Agelaius phoeniceus]
MGGSASLIPRDLLSEYQELTFLSKQEILLAYKRFSELLPKEERENACSLRVPKSQILTLPELRANPFQQRICHVFSTSETEDGSMSFEDFLDMLSVFSDSATSDIKSYYAFRIFDPGGVRHRQGRHHQPCRVPARCLPLPRLRQLLQDCPVSPWLSSSTPPAPPALLQFLQLSVGSAISSFREHRSGPSVARLCCNALGRNPPAPLSGACLAAGSPRNLPLLRPFCCLSIRI